MSRFHHLLDAEQECLATIFFSFLSLSRSHLLVSHTTSSYYSSSHSTQLLTLILEPDFTGSHSSYNLSLSPLLPCFLLSTDGVHRISILLVSLPFQPQRSDIVLALGPPLPASITTQFAKAKVGLSLLDMVLCRSLN